VRSKIKIGSVNRSVDRVKDTYSESRKGKKIREKVITHVILVFLIFNIFSLILVIDLKNN